MPPRTFATLWLWYGFPPKLGLNKFAAAATINYERHMCIVCRVTYLSQMLPLLIQVFSILDYSTNYCNLHNLYAGVPVRHILNLTRETLGSCRQHTASACASGAPRLVRKIARVLYASTTSGSDLISNPLQVANRKPPEKQCPIVSTQANFSLENYISKRWFVQQQMAVQVCSHFRNLYAWWFQNVRIDADVVGCSSHASLTLALVISWCNAARFWHHFRLPGISFALLLLCCLLMSMGTETSLRCALILRTWCCSTCQKRGITVCKPSMFRGNPKVSLDGASKCITTHRLVNEIVYYEWLFLSTNSKVGVEKRCVLAWRNLFVVMLLFICYWNAFTCQQKCTIESCEYPSSTSAAHHFWIYILLRHTRACAGWSRRLMALCTTLVTPYALRLRTTRTRRNSRWRLASCPRSHPLQLDHTGLWHTTKLRDMLWYRADSLLCTLRLDAAQEQVCVE